MYSNNVVNEVFTDIERGLFEKANGLLTDNFKTTVLGKEVNRTAYISTYRALLQAMPDMKFHVQEVKVDGDKVTAKVLMSGRNSKPFPPLMKGWRQIPATNRQLEGVIADLEITLKGDKIERISNHGKEKGLFISVMESLGLDYQKFQQN